MYDARPLPERYAEWRNGDDGRTIAADIKTRAQALFDRGFRHYGIAALFEAARYDRSLKVGPDAEGWKLNNNWRSFLARELMATYSQLEGFFEVRETTGWDGELEESVIAPPKDRQGTAKLWRCVECGTPSTAVRTGVSPTMAVGRCAVCRKEMAFR